MAPTVYLITGANRGIGFKLVEAIASRPDTIIFAGARTLNKEDQLGQLAAKLPQVVFPIQITSASEEDNKAAAKVVKEQVGKVDVVIANAGIATEISPAVTASIDALRSMFEVNTVGPLILFQAFHGLFSEASKFAVVSSAAGQITEAIPYPVTSYGSSKAAVNFITKKIDQENENITAFPLHPGMVATDMGESAAKSFGTTTAEMGAISPEESAKAVLALIDKATKQTHGGKFWNYTGEELRY